MPATLFLNARWIEANPAIARELAAGRLFEFGNLGVAHLPLSTMRRSAYGIRGTAAVDEVLEEVLGRAWGVQAVTGAATPWFRAGTAYLDDIKVQAVAALGMVPVSFSVNADGGATFPANTVAAQLATIRPGDIAISHMNQPLFGTAAGLAMSLPALIARGISFTTLSRANIPVPDPWTIQ